MAIQGFVTMPQSSHDLHQQKVRGICGVEHGRLAYDTRYLRISAVSNPNQLNGTSRTSNKSAHVCAKCPIPSCASPDVPLASWPTQRRISVPPIRPSRFNWMRRGRKGAGGILLILTVQFEISGCQGCERSRLIGISYASRLFGRHAARVFGHSVPF
jgi:hypothetical protein